MGDIELICPTCKKVLSLNKIKLISCCNCSEQFPIVDTVPILLSDSNHLFNKKSFSDLTSSGFGSGFSSAVSKYLPDISFNKFQDRAIDRFINSLKKDSVCLIVGAGNDDKIKNHILNSGSKVIVTDVIKLDMVDYVCDVTSLPFSENQFDAVFIIAVLEHVIEPITSVSEISRVLKKYGLVFSSIPFMQQVHMGCFDFQRYTLLGHRWLFSSFKLIELAPTSGSGSVLLWSITSFFQSFFKGRKYSLVVKALIRIFLFWIKYFDLFQKNTNDYALGSYFVGKNMKKKIVSHEQLILLYKDVG